MGGKIINPPQKSMFNQEQSILKTDEMSKAALSTSTPLLSLIQVICGNPGQDGCPQAIPDGIASCKVFSKCFYSLAVQV